MNTENREEVREANKKMLALMEQFASSLGLKVKGCSVTFGMGELGFKIKLVDPNPSTDAMKKKFAYTGYQFHDIVKSSITGKEFRVLDITSRGGIIAEKVGEDGKRYKLNNPSLFVVVRHADGSPVAPEVK